MPCLQCRYNLHGLKADDRCPECGASIRETLHIWTRSVNGQQIPAVADALTVLAWAPLLIAGLTLACLSIGVTSGFWGLGVLATIYGGIGILGYICAHFGFIANVEQAIGRDAHWNWLWYGSLGSVTMLVISAMINAAIIIVVMVIIGWLILHAWSAHMAMHLADRGHWDSKRSQARMVSVLSFGGAALLSGVVLLAGLLGFTSRSMMFELLGLTVIIAFAYGVLMSILHCVVSIRLLRHLRAASRITQACVPASATRADVRSQAHPPPGHVTGAGSPFGPMPATRRLPSPQTTTNPPLGKGI